MRKVLGIFCLIFFLPACVSNMTEFQPPKGVLYTHIKAPLKTNVSNSMITLNQGKAETITFQWGIWGMTDGNASVEKAINSAIMDNVEYADYEYTNVLFGIYQEMTVYVYGTDKIEEN